MANGMMQALRHRMWREGGEDSGKSTFILQPPADYAVGDKVLLTGTIAEARDRGNLVIQVGETYFTMDVTHLDAVDMVRQDAPAPDTHQAP